MGGARDRDERPKKKRRTWFRDKHQRQRVSDGLGELKGRKGFLVTCEQSRERQAIAHATNFLSQVRLLRCFWLVSTTK